MLVLSPRLSRKRKAGDFKFPKEIYSAAGGGVILFKPVVD